MFGIIPRVLWSRQTQTDELNRMALQTNCVLLRSDQRTVLIESGFGTDWTDRLRGIYGLEDRWIVPALAEVGVSPNEIDDVFLSHLHFDHGGGVTKRGEDGVHRPTFPNARIHVQKTEWDDALANKTTMRGTFLKENLEPIRDFVNLLDGACAPVDGVRVMPAPGHTWGQQAIIFDDKHGTLVFPGDVIPTAMHADSAFNMAFDMLPYQNMLTKRDLFERCATDHWRIILAHQSGDPIRCVQRDDAGPGAWYRLGPVSDPI